MFLSSFVMTINGEELKYPFFLENVLKQLRLGVSFIKTLAYWNARTEGPSNNSFWANFKFFKNAWHNRTINKKDYYDN